MTKIPFHFDPPRYLRSGHTQTLLSGRLTSKGLLTTEDFERSATTSTLHSRDGVRLQAKVNAVSTTAPNVILLHGWLGGADSTYLRRTTAAFTSAGFNVVRLQLRDHGGTHALNEEMFNSSRLVEVIDACNAIAEQTSQPIALIGYSLGGNFALRLAASNQLDTKIQLAIGICPAINPTTAAHAIDTGWFGYQWYFVQKWRRALSDKASAFPHLYELSTALQLNSVSAITDLFVRHYTPFDTTAQYYDAYRITADMLAASRCPTVVLTAIDDPVIPIGDFADIAEHPALEYHESQYGGHCAFINSWQGHSPLDAWLISRVLSKFEDSD